METFLMLGLGDVWVAVAFWLNVLLSIFCVCFAVLNKFSNSKKESK